MRNPSGEVPAAVRDFDEFYREHEPAVRKLVRRRLGGRGLADDAVQETFLRVYRSRSSLDPTRPAGPWVHAIADNVCTDMLRRSAVQPEDPKAAPVDEQVGNGVPLDSDAPAEQYFASERRAGVADVLRTIHPRQRRMLMLNAHGYGREELASLEGTTVQAAKANLQRGRESFRLKYIALAARRGLLALAAFLGARALIRARLGALRVHRAMDRIGPAGLEVAVPTGLVSVAMAVGVLTGVLGGDGGSGGGSLALGGEASRPASMEAAVLGYAPPPLLHAVPKTATAPPSDAVVDEPPAVRHDIDVGDTVSGTTEVERAERQISARAQAERVVPGSAARESDVSVTVTCNHSAPRRAACAVIDAAAGP